MLFHKPFESRLAPHGLVSWVIFLGVMLSFLCGCNGKAPPAAVIEAPQRVFRMNLGTEPPDLDPIKVIDLTSFNVVLNLMRGLVQFNATGTLAPAMAERWEKSPDGLRYVFYLRRDARWSDGKPVTAPQFVDGWQRALDPKQGAEYAFFLFELKNGRAYYEGKLKDFGQVGVRAVDDHTLVVRLERPVAYFLDLMAAPIALPIRRDLIQRYGERFTEAGRFLSNGPYVLDQWVHEEKIILKPNPYYYAYYHGLRPQVDRVDMRMVSDANTSVVMYENGALDFIETPSSIPAFDVRRLRHHPDCHRGTLHAIYYIGFNTAKPPFDNPKIRQAFTQALDRSYFPRLLQGGQRPIKSFITPGLAGYNPTIGLDFNPTKARQLLAEAGYPNGKGFPPVTLAYRTMYDIQKEMEIAQYLWKKNLNVDVRLQNMDWKVFLGQMHDHPPELFRLNWYVDYPDADSFLSLFTADNGNNFTRWKDPQYDAWVAAGAITQDPARRQRLYDQAQKRLLEEATVLLPIYMGEKIYLVKPHVQGLVVNGLNLLLLEGLNLHPRNTSARPHPETACAP